MVAGKVNNQASKIFRTVSFLRFFTPLLATILPAIPDERTWVVLTGKLNQVENAMVVAATNSEDAPWA